MTDNDDWFERALRELEADSEPSDRKAGRSTAREDEVGGASGDSSAAEPTHGSADADTDDFGFEAPQGESGPGPDDFGFADFGESDGTAADPFGAPATGGTPGGFDADLEEMELDSDVERVQLGIDGLDSMILGGIPKRSLVAVIGSAGTGKTTFALQFLQHGLTAEERAVYITLEESRDAILSTAEEKGWPFREYVDDDRLAVVSMDPIEMANSLSSIRSDLSRLVADYDADRLVLDSVSLLEMMYDHPAKRRSQVFEFTRSLKEVGVTTLLTSEASEESPYTSRYGIVEYLTDAVFVLRYVRTSNFQETRLAVEIQKIRDANHSRETKPYEITNEGINVYQQANLF